MRKIIFVSFAVFLCLALCPAMEIKGRVFSSDGKPIKEAIVLHRASGQKVFTNEEGYFELEVSDEKRVRLEIIHSDYMEEEVVLSSLQASRPVQITLVPLIKQREEVIVTALRYPEPSAKVPAAGTVVSSESVNAKLAPNITESLNNLTGVSSLGSGGFSLVPSIRGLARSRVLILIDNARLTSDRRVGPSASFIDPDDIDRIEVLRSPSSVFYGSDAIGGVIHIFTQKPSFEEGLKGRLNAKYGTVNNEKSFGFSLQGKKKSWGFFLSLQTADAEDYSSPQNEVLQSRYTQSSALGKIIYQTEKRNVILSFLGARGRNIGKPNRDSHTKPTWYPRENQNLFQIHWKENDIGGLGELTFQAYLNPNFLETRSDRIEAFKSKESFSKTQSLDFGFQLSLGRMISSNFRLNGGADFFGRSGVEAKNIDKSFDAQGRVTSVFEETPYDRGKRQDFGIFISGDYSGFENFDLVGGIRWDYLQTEAYPGGGSAPSASSHHALTGFLATSVKLMENFVAFANLSRAYRAPNLNEKFYTGITGRGFIIAQPGLKPEMSLNFDAGFKFISRHIFAGLYGFYYIIDDMVERYLVASRIYTYGNVEKGEIIGLETEIEYFPFPGWKLFGNLTAIKGRSVKTDAPLNDIPPLRLNIGTQIWIKRFSFELNSLLQRKKDNPGPAEIPIKGVEVFQLKVRYDFNSSWNFYLVLANAFNKYYFGRPDPEAMEEPGRNLLLGISYSF